MRHLFVTLLLVLALFPAPPLVAQTTEPALATLAAPRYLLSSGISFDAVERQSSSVSTLGILVAAPGGLPLYQLTTIETSLGRAVAGQTSNAATLRAGIAQTAYQRGYAAVGICGDAGVMKTGDVTTLGTFTGCGWLSYDIGGRLTRGKSHVYLIPSVRLIAVNGVQVKPSWSLRIGTGF